MDHSFRCYSRCKGGDPANNVRAKHRTSARQTADRLGNVQRSKVLMALLTEEERDWLRLLRERFYEIQHGRF